MLFSAGTGEGPKPCAFFGTVQGCRSGASCPFMHGNQAPKTQVIAPHPVAAVEGGKKRKESSGSAVKPERIDSPALIESSAFHAPEQDLRKLEVASEEKTKEEKKKKPSFVADDFKLKQKDKHMKQRKEEKIVDTIRSYANVAVPFIPEKAPLPQLSQPVVEVHNNNSDDSDSEFLFNAVDIAIKGTQQVSPLPPQPAANQMRQSSSSSMTPSSSYQAPHFQQPPPPPQWQPPVSTQSSFFSSPQLPPPPRSLAPPPRIPANTASGKGNSSNVYGNSPFVSNERVPERLGTSGSEHAVSGAASKKRKSDEFNSLPAEPSSFHSSSLSMPPAAALPASPASLDLTFTYNQLLPLVAVTRNHPRYATEYAFETDTNWVAAKPYGDW